MNKHAFDFEVLKEEVKEVFDFKVKLGIVMICLNEEQFISASLRAVIKNPKVIKVAVVEGAVYLFAHASKENGLSLDDTHNQVLKVMGEDNGAKIIYDRLGWASDKSKLRNRALMLLPEEVTHVLVVDADEVWKTEELDNLIAGIEKFPLFGAYFFPFYHFWKRKDLVAVGGQWDNKMFRCFKYLDKKLHWGLHQAPVVNENGDFINVTDGSLDLPVHVYHFGYLKSEKNVLDKLEYYKKRDTDLPVDPEIYTKWEMGKASQPTHGGGRVTKFEGELPEEVAGLV